MRVSRMEKYDLRKTSAALHLRRPLVHARHCCVAEPMTSAFAIGCGVAGAAYALKGVLHVGSKLAQNPEAMKQAAALGAGLRGAGSVFKVPSFLSFTKHAGGFDAVMNRREAALILNCRRVLPAQLASVCARAPA